MMNTLHNNLKYIIKKLLSVNGLILTDSYIFMKSTIFLINLFSQEMMAFLADAKL